MNALSRERNAPENYVVQVGNLFGGRLASERLSLQRAFPVPLPLYIRGI